MKKTNYMNTFFPNAPPKTDIITKPQLYRTRAPNPPKSSPLNFSTLLDRDATRKEITDILNSFESHYNNIHYKKGIYIYGSPGSGKTHFVIDLLKSLDYDVIKYDAGDVRNKSLIDTITSNNISNRNVLDMMNKKEKKIEVADE